MRKVLYILLTGSILVGCSTHKSVVMYNSPDFTDKELGLFANNLVFTTKSVVGGLAWEEIQKQEKYQREKREQQRVETLKQIKDIEFIPVVGENETTHYQANISNDVLFAFNSSNLSERAMDILDNFSGVVSQMNDVELHVIGHTDNVGEQAVNDRLSLERANSVADYIVLRGITNSLIKREGKGYFNPICDNDSPTNRARNRRVEILIIPVSKQ